MGVGGWEDWWAWIGFEGGGVKITKSLRKKEKHLKLFFGFLKKSGKIAEKKNCAKFLTKKNKYFFSSFSQKMSSKLF